MNIQIDTLAYTNRLRDLPPGEKLLFALASLLLALVSHPFVQLSIGVWLSIWMIIYARIPVRVYWQMMVAISTFLLMSLPTLIINIIPINQHNLLNSDLLAGVNFAQWYIYVSRSGLIQAEAIFIRAIACSSCLFFILLTIPFVEILTVFRKIGCPVILTELLLLMYRFIFLLIEIAQQMSIAQQVRGGYQNRTRAMYSLSLLIRQLFQKTLERYHQLSLGINARGFQGKFQFWQPHKYHHSKRYALEAILGYLGLVGWQLWL
jgi:cobalt/nickel transport system permease protein